MRLQERMRGRLKRGRKSGEKTEGGRLFSCNVNTRLSSDNLSDDGLRGKLGPEASNVPAFPYNQHD